MNLEQLKPEVLAHFTGTEAYHRIGHWGNVVATDGVMHVLENAEAFWLFDEIAARDPAGNVDMEVWKLTVDPETRKGTLNVTDGNGEPVELKLPIAPIVYTDFPLPEITFWLIDTVLMLPSEY